MASPKATKVDASQTGELLATVAEGDTVYADVYLRRARELLAPVLTRSQHESLKRIQDDIDGALNKCKTATAQQDWKRVEALATEVEQLRARALAGAAMRNVGHKIYDRVGVPVDPFSPGFESLPGHGGDRADLRKRLVAMLATLAGSDQALASFYDSRRSYLAGLALASSRVEAGDAPSRSTAEVHQLAMQAAQRGDVGQLRQYAQELIELEKAQPKKAKKATAEAPAASTVAAAYRCPVDLSAPLPDEAVRRARSLGLAAVRTQPMQQAEQLYDYVATRIWQPSFAASSATEGAVRAEATIDEVGFPPEAVEGVKVLVGQLLLNPFINSGGARYLPGFNVESVLLEDFPEDGAPDATTGLLPLLGLQRRHGLSRAQIDDALLDKGGAVLEQHLGLDPREFRLVCIPQDIYMRVGRDQGWGQRQQWTHFDGYQVLRSGGLRALAGGDVRYGGLSDLVSIEISDQRERVVARFAVIRRARQVARWI